MKRYCLTVDLADDPELIAEYERYHQAVWPEVLDALRAVGVLDMEIYRFANRMFMIMETVDDFSFEAKAAADAAIPTVQRWEQTMLKYQRALPQAKGEKWLWMRMEKIFSLN